MQNSNPVPITSASAKRNRAIAFVTKKEHQALERRVKALEEIASDMADIKVAIVKICKYIKWAAPSLVSAAIAAGVVNGQIGAFLHALVNG